MDTIKIKATLKLATMYDVFNGTTTFCNKKLFVKCPSQGNFIGSYTIPELDTRNYEYYTTPQQKQEVKARNDFYRKELAIGLASQVFYVLSEKHNDFDFQFKLKLRVANDFDFFDTDQSKPNVVYYVKLDENNVTGPHILPAITDAAYLQNAISKKILFVPDNNQSFEPIKIALAS